MLGNYEMADGSWDMEREAADYEQAELEAQGRDHSRRMKKVDALHGTDPAAAAAACNHGWGYPLDSLAARDDDDPRAGEEGHRCLNCGSVISEFGRSAAVLIPCELPPAPRG